MTTHAGTSSWWFSVKVTKTCRSGWMKITKIIHAPCTLLLLLDPLLFVFVLLSPDCLFRLIIISFIITISCRNFLILDFDCASLKF
jgi:hypothetical protein